MQEYSQSKSSHNVESTTELTQEEFSSFIGKNAEKYIRKFRKFHVDGGDSFSVTWHWPAFFFGFWWLLYRKLYVWAFIALFLLLIPFWFFVNPFVYGIIANYIYYRKAKKKILKYKNLQPSVDPSQMALALSKIGGVRKWPVVLFAVIGWLGILFCINYPSTYHHRTRSYNKAAETELYYAAVAQEEYFAEHDKYAESMELLVAPEYGLRIDEQVVITVQDASSTSYVMSAYHKRGNKLYFMDGPNGKIQEIDMSD